MWMPPGGWTGPPAALYRSFDGSDGLELYVGNETSEMNAPSLVPGRVRTITL